MAEELVSRIERLEESERRAWSVIETLGTRQNNLDDALAYVGSSLARLAEAQMKTEERFKDIEERFLDLEKHSRETDDRIEKHSRETEALIAKLGRETDARIEKLVIAIGVHAQRQD
jgi:predicted  nucleic acid-binding Zn-ribbon protein